MSLNPNDRIALETAIPDSLTAKRVFNLLSNAAQKPASPATIAALTASATSGTLPTPNSAVTIADATAPTVVELQEFCVELNAKINAIRAALTAIGATT